MAIKFNGDLVALLLLGGKAECSNLNCIGGHSYKLYN